jgi:hypothetical protein
MPSVSDTLTKVWGTHTAKAGFFYEWIRNGQPANNNSNGYMQFVPSANPTFSYGDAYADELAGNLSSYNEQNFNRINDISYNTYEGFIQDSWKVTSRLTVEAGLGMTHFTPWIDREGFGYSVFIPSQYDRRTMARVRPAQRFADFSGTVATVPSRWADSRQELSFGSLVSESHTT